MMRKINRDWRDKRLILNLYEMNKTEIEVNRVKKEAKIRIGVNTRMPTVPIPV